MTTTVQQFIKDKLPVVTVTLSDSLVTASKRMIEHDFSQLPVINSDNRPIGIITSDLILKALNNYGTSLKGIRIKHVMFKKPQVFRQDIDLLDLFDDMDGPYALIVDDEGRLVQIITSDDTAKYFRQRANDILLVENIESTLKDYVQLAFSSRPDGETKLNQAIQNMTNSALALRPKFDKGIRNYLGKLPRDEKIVPNADLINEMFEKHFDDKQPLATFDDLTLAQYIALFLHKDHWSLLEGVLELNKEALTNILDSVRQTRNDLSHFRDITRDQGYQLRDCYDLLISHQAEIVRAFPQYNADVEVKTEERVVSEQEMVGTEVIQPLEDEPASGESRYAPLAIWLQEQKPDTGLVDLSFADIEKIVDGPLPESAKKNRSWWANDSVGHVQSKQWLDVDWRVASVNMSAQTVRFARIRERQRAYIDFFSALITGLRQEPGFARLQTMPDGVNWYVTKNVAVQDKVIASFGYSFGRGGIFRVELYIDTGEETVNKLIYDGLQAQKEAIEAEFGHELVWQRLDNRRASRISYHFQAHITDSEAELTELRQKAVLAMVNFVRVMQPLAEAVGKEVLRN